MKMKTYFYSFLFSYFIYYFLYDQTKILMIKKILMVLFSYFIYYFLYEETKSFDDKKDFDSEEFQNQCYFFNILF
jgi:hypothetical protein